MASLEVGQSMSKQLSILKKTLGKSVLKNEVILLNKWMYKNKNQHRRADYFHKLCSVHRHWKKFIAIKLQEWIKEYTDCPSQDALKDGCFKLFYAFALLQKTQSEIMIAYTAFRKQVELTYFMSVSLFAMGICARLQYLIQDLLEKIQDAYDSLKDSSVKIPNVLSLRGFINRNLEQNEPLQKKVEENISSSEDDHCDGQAEKLESILSQEFWLKADDSKSVKKRNTQDSSFKKNRKLKLEKKSTKKDDLDKIFGLLE